MSLFSCKPQGFLLPIILSLHINHLLDEEVECIKQILSPPQTPLLNILQGFKAGMLRKEIKDVTALLNILRGFTAGCWGKNSGLRKNIWQWQTHMYLVQSKQSDVGNESSSFISAICWNMGWGRPASCQIFSILICQPGDKILWKTYWLFKWKINYLDYSNELSFSEFILNFHLLSDCSLPSSALFTSIYVHYSWTNIRQYDPTWIWNSQAVARTVQWQVFILCMRRRQRRGEWRQYLRYPGWLHLVTLVRVNGLE